MPAAATPVAVPPATPVAVPAVPGPAPAVAPPAEAPASFWVLASEVNEVRRKPIAEGVNPAGQWVDIDLGEQVLVAYEGDRPVYATVVSSGRSVPTPMGNYPLWAKASSITMKSQPYDDKAYFVNKVPWVLFFQAHNAIHGAYWHDRFGVSKSHGCANVSPLDARHLFEWMKPELPPGWSSIRPVDLRESVTVHVYNSQLKKPFRQERPIGPPDRDDEAERLDLAEKRRADTAAAIIPAATPPNATPAPVAPPR
jgi:lipoprotein-anchoring transpeptidase ErfK/SrfK